MLIHWGSEWSFGGSWEWGLCVVGDCLIENGLYGLVLGQEAQEIEEERKDGSERSTYSSVILVNVKKRVIPIGKMEKSWVSI